MYLIKTGDTNDTSLYIKDYSAPTKQTYEPTITNAVKIVEHQNVDFVIGSVERWDNLLND